MRVKIFSCHYREPMRSLNTPIFQSCVSGMHSAPDGSFLGDLGGVNISDKNEYSEVRHHYYVWKNLTQDYDYIGFEHYRRMFFINPMNFERMQSISSNYARHTEHFDTDQVLIALERDKEEFYEHISIREQFTAEDIDNFKTWLSKFDVVVPRMWLLHDRPHLEAEWKNGGLPPSMWEMFTEAMGKHEGFRPLPQFPVRTSNHNSMFIMKTKLFCEYMENLFACIEDLDALMQGQIHDFPRKWGYVCEKALNYFILSQRKKTPFFSVAQIPLINHTIVSDIY